jgi:hypothetical protein
MKKKFSLLIALSMLLLVAIPVQAAPSMDTSVFSVEENEYVTMVLEKFPANETYYVFMGEYGTYGMGGELVSKLTTNNGGTFLATFPIPDELYNEDRIAIRFQSASGKSVWWNWFFNDTSKGSYYYGGKFPTDLRMTMTITMSITTNWAMASRPSSSQKLSEASQSPFKL